MGMRSFKLRVLFGCSIAAAGLWFARHYVVATPPAMLSLAQMAEPQFGYTVRQGTSGTCIYLFHGLRSDRSYWNDQPYRTFVDARLKAGDELVLVDLPYAEAGLFSDGGAAYCAAFGRSLRAFDATLTPKRTFAVGTSWGGMHAAIASAELSSVDAYVSIAPVVEVGRLTEMWMVSNEHCTQAAYVGRLKPGLVLYGDSDDRAGSDLIAQSVVETGAESVVYPGIGHETTAPILHAASSWIDRRIHLEAARASAETPASRSRAPR
jgi:hypothetical protein